jgi:prevent-host-death family protein
VTTVTVHVAKTQLSKLIARAEAGEEVIIARGKKPVVRLVAVAETKPQGRFGAMKGRASVGPEFFEPLPEDELKLWEGG